MSDHPLTDPTSEPVSNPLPDDALPDDALPNDTGAHDVGAHDTLSNGADASDAPEAVDDETSTEPAALDVDDEEHAAPESEVDEGEKSSGAVSRAKQLENEGDIAADYLEELLDIADLDGDLDIDIEGDRAAVSIVGAELTQLVGQNGEVLEALQELTRLAVYRETGERSRLMLDISGHRARRRAELEVLAAEVVDSVVSTGEPQPLAAMSPFERKVVHDVVAARGLRSESEGVEPRRHVVVLPA